MWFYVYQSGAHDGEPDISLVAEVEAETAAEAIAQTLDKGLSCAPTQRIWAEETAVADARAWARAQREGARLHARQGEDD